MVTNDRTLLEQCPGIYLLRTETRVSAQGIKKRVYKIGVSGDVKGRVADYSTYLWKPRFLSALLFRSPFTKSLEDLKMMEGRMLSEIGQLNGWECKGEKFSFEGEERLPPEFLGILFLKALNSLQLQD